MNGNARNLGKKTKRKKRKKIAAWFCRDCWRLWEPPMQMTERKTQYLPSVPDLPMDFAHVFQGKVVTLLQSTFSSYTIHSLWAGVLCYKLELLCVVTVAKWVYHSYFVSSDIATQSVSKLLCSVWQWMEVTEFDPSQDVIISTTMSELYIVKLCSNPGEKRSLILGRGSRNNDPSLCIELVQPLNSFTCI